MLSDRVGWCEGGPEQETSANGGGRGGMVFSAMIDVEVRLSGWVPDRIPASIGKGESKRLMEDGG